MSNDTEKENIEDEIRPGNAEVSEKKADCGKRDEKKAPIGAEGHRKRMFDELKKNGSRNMTDYRILEMLLYFSIPRSDTREQAKRLIEQAGSLENVFDMSYDEFRDIYQVGDRTALLLLVVSEIYRMMKAEKKRPKKVLKSDRDIAEFFLDVIPEDSKEHFVILFMDDGNKVKKYEVFDSPVAGAFTIDRQRIISMPAWSRAAYVAIAHNHPGGSEKPSPEDDLTTAQLQYFANERNVGFRGHFLVAGGKVIRLAQRR